MPKLIMLFDVSDPGRHLKALVRKLDLIDGDLLPHKNVIKWSSKVLAWKQTGRQTDMCMRSLYLPTHTESKMD